MNRNNTCNYPMFQVFKSRRASTVRFFRLERSFLTLKRLHRITSRSRVTSQTIRDQRSNDLTSQLRSRISGPKDGIFKENITIHLSRIKNNNIRQRIKRKPITSILCLRISVHRNPFPNRFDSRVSILHFRRRTKRSRRNSTSSTSTTSVLSVQSFGLCREDSHPRTCSGRIFRQDNVFNSRTINRGFVNLNYQRTM